MFINVLGKKSLGNGIVSLCDASYSIYKKKPKLSLTSKWLDITIVKTTKEKKSNDMRILS